MILSNWKVFQNSRQIYEFAREQFYADADREQFYALTLDSKNRLIGVNLVSQGSLTGSIVTPAESFKPVLLSNAAAVAFVHNHPSGDCAPSREDRECTARLVKAGRILGIRVIDHIVCGWAEYFSFADAGLLDECSEEVREMAADFNATGKGRPETTKRRIQMKKKKETKGGTPAKAKSAKTIKAAPAGRNTIKQVVIDLITASGEISNEAMIAAVKARFPKSAFDARHAAWYRSRARKGLLTGTPILIPSQIKRLETRSE